MQTQHLSVYKAQVLSRGSCKLLVPTHREALWTRTGFGPRGKGKESPSLGFGKADKDTAGKEMS